MASKCSIYNRQSLIFAGYNFSSVKNDEIFQRISTNFSLIWYIDKVAKVCSSERCESFIRKVYPRKISKKHL